MESHVRESLVNDSCTAHGQHASQEYAVHALPSEGIAHADTQCHHRKDDGDGGDGRTWSQTNDFLEGEVESQREEQKHHTDVCPHLDILRVNHRHGIWHVRTHQEARHDISKYQRLFQPFEDECYESGND